MCTHSQKDLTWNQIKYSSFISSAVGKCVPAASYKMKIWFYLLTQPRANRLDGPQAGVSHPAKGAVLYLVAEDGLSSSAGFGSSHTFITGPCTALLTCLVIYLFSTNILLHNSWSICRRVSPGCVVVCVPVHVHTHTPPEMGLLSKHARGEYNYSTLGGMPCHLPNPLC